MFGRNNRPMCEEQDADPAFRYQSTTVPEANKTEYFPFHLKGNANQTFISRPPNTISYRSPTSNDTNKMQGGQQRTDSRHVEESTAQYNSTEDQRERAPRYTDMSTSSLTRLQKLDPAHHMVASRSHATHRSKALDLKHNDNSFHVVAKLLVGRFEDQLSNNKVTSIRITAGDSYHLNRVVPEKNSFIEAVQFRLKSCPEESSKSIHVVTRQCQALGLDRNGEHNLLHAPIGSNFPIGGMMEQLNPVSKRTSDKIFGVVDNDAVKNAKPNNRDDLAQQQLATELREASNLMAESVTPEASQFWRNQVAELQAKLRALQAKGVQQAEYHTPCKEHFNPDKEESDLPGLWQNVGYIPPNQDKKTLIPDTVIGIGEFIGERVSSSGQYNKEENELPIVDVVAPSDLPGDYQFEAELNGKRFIATVPNGGVQKGQTFFCYMEESTNDGIPIGRWRDTPFDCFKNGINHSMLLKSTLCPLLALAQVMERMGLDITGKKVIDKNIPHNGLWSPRGMAISILSFWIVLNIIIVSGFELKLYNYASLSAGDMTSIILVNASMVVFTVYATVNTRTSIMERYQIPVGKLGRRIETMQSALFFPLTIAQMRRHTTSDDDNGGACCADARVTERQGP